MSRLTRAIHRHHTEPGQVCSPRTPFHTIYDGHGSVRGLTDASANLTDTYSYDAFGTITEQTGTSFNNFLYAGEQFDADLGFYYNRARYLNAETGRFWSMDSYEGTSFDPVSLHKYLFGGNNAPNRIDPSGKVGIIDTIITYALQAALFVLTNATFHAVATAILATIDVALFFGDEEYRNISLATGHNPIASAGYIASRGIAIFGRATNIVGTSATELGIRLLNRARPPNLGNGRIFTHFTSAEGVEGITGIVGESMEIGQQVTVARLRYGRGSNNFLAVREGDIFVTELGPNASAGELQSIGVFGSKQNFAIQFSEETAFFQNARVTPSDPSRSIYTIPGDVVLEGEFVITRLR